MALVTPQAYRSFATVLARLFPSAARPTSLFGATGVSPGSFVHPTARLEPGVVVDPGVVIGPQAEIGAETVLAAGCVVGRTCGSVGLAPSAPTPRCCMPS